MPKFRNGLAKAGKVYHYCFRVNGQQFKGSTRASDRPSAEQVLAAKRKEALLGPQETPVPMPTVHELVDLWVSSFKSTHSDRHIESVQGFAKVWINPAIGDLRIDRISTQAILDLRQSVLDAGRSPSTANLLLRVLSLLMSHAIRLGHIKQKPFRVAPLRVQRKPRSTVPANRFQEFLATVDEVTSDPQKRLALRVMVGLGMRASEVMGMRIEWFSFEARTYTVGKSKGKEARVLPIPNWLWQAFEGAPAILSPWLFPNTEGNPHNRSFLRQTLLNVAERMGIGRLTLHRLRATHATLLNEAGVGTASIQELLGHKQIQTTLKYIETNLDSKRRAQEALSMKLGLA